MAYSTGPADGHWMTTADDVRVWVTRASLSYPQGRPMSYVTTHAACRVCKAADLSSVLDMGKPALSGQFPGPDDPDPPTAPLHVVRCRACGLVQLEHSVDPELMFRNYHYRSGLTQTMRAHLRQLAEEAAAMLSGRQGQICVAPRILDVGGNDGELMNAIPLPTGRRVIIDPSNVPLAHEGIQKITGFFPNDILLTQKYDLIFAIACFYDSPDPVAWASASRALLAADGLWVVEVADLFAMLQNVDYPAVCHEHLLYLSPHAVDDIARRANLKVVRAEPNGSNGGSIRYYITHRDSTAYQDPEWAARVAALVSHGKWLTEDDEPYARFRKAVEDSRTAIRQIVTDEVAAGGRVHLLAASTKSNTVLSYCDLGNSLIEAASDRDPRKAGRRTPQTDIPIVSEEDSRLAAPTLYLSLAKHFKDEMVVREAAHLARGGRILFPLPQPEVVTA